MGKEVTTVKDLITTLLEFPMDQEVLVDSDNDSIFCMIAKDIQGSSETKDVLERADEPVEPKPKRHRKSKTKPMLSYEEKMIRRQEQYRKSYGATAFKYPIRNWTAAEEAIVMTHPEEKDLILCEVLHRSLAAIHTRRWIIRNREGNKV